MASTVETEPLNIKMPAAVSPKRHAARLLPLVTAMLLVLACGNSSKSSSSLQPPDEVVPPVDLSVALFAPDHLIEVQVEIDEDEWDLIRGEGRSVPDIFSGCGRDYNYTYYSALVTVDGDVYEDVAIRKKGFLGSLSTLRPSLKLNFGKFVDGRTHADRTRMTLNNNLQDPSNTHQCMTYELFEKAGAIAPRCNFARVVVNGEDLGIYTHVESVKKPMLRRHFEDEDGNLYEGQAADFVENSVDLIELKTNETENDRSDLDALVEALEVEDDALIEALSDVIDFDSFLTFWAMEVMAGHWDSYSGGRNNYLTYHDPTSDRFHFIPWGTDGAFALTRLFNPANTAASVLAEGRIANRLYAHPEGRAMYFARLGELFEEVWHEEEMAAEAERIGALTNAPASLIAAQQDFIYQHGDALRAELMIAPAEAVDWIDGPSPRTAPQCPPILGTMAGTFATTWQTGGPTPGGSANVTLATNSILRAPLVTSAGVAPALDPNLVQILVVSIPQSLVLIVRVPLPYFVPGETIEMHGFESSAILARINLMAPTEAPVILGFTGSGTITLDEASTVPGQPVSGSFEGLFAPLNSL